MKILHPFKAIAYYLLYRHHQRRLIVCELEHISTMLEGIYAKDADEIMRNLKFDGNSPSVRSGRAAIYKADAEMEKYANKLRML